MKFLMIIFACLFCLAATPAIADYACAIDAKACSGDIGKLSTGTKAALSHHGCCHINMASIAAPAMKIVGTSALHTPPLAFVLLKPAHKVGPLLEPPTA